MISLEDCKVLLEQQEGIEDTEVCEGAYVRGYFANRLNPSERDKVVVEPLPKRAVLSVRVPDIGAARSPKSELFRVLQDINYRLALGSIGTDDRDGEVSFVINHPCRDDGEADPTPEVFARLIRVAIHSAHDIRMMATHVAMVESGVSEAVARKVLEQVVASSNGEDENEEML